MLDRGARLLGQRSGRLLAGLRDGRVELADLVSFLNKALIDPSKTHPINQWVAVAQTYDGKTYRSYVNGVLASPLVPEGALAKFVGENPNGVWTLTIVDDLAGDTGTLDQWALSLTTFATAPTQAPVQSFVQNTR